ncbi:Mpo1-like protein [Paucibacter sp. APW11]|uniref:Mpo1-like protein n=1 Tax=Roseateles aquae TaxID=3077235 RepID=A0ABU3PBR4_9BURK|nr:Mpo1-like protein [Paucibacter sp. APW11]MDT8999251.1 Mpo1-like protein [Paucibacter sp. APW11]
MAASPFRPAIDLMAQYAAYHRDRRNIATHFVGIPLIVFAIEVLLARAQFELGGMALSAATLLWAASTLWYLTRGNLVLGLAVSVVNGALLAAAMPLALGSTSSWLAWGVGGFVIGWIIQFIGHYYEGRKPAFVDDLVGLLVGPMFVVGEALFALGWGREMLAEIERRVGPTHLRDLAHPAA